MPQSLGRGRFVNKRPSIIRKCLNYRRIRRNQILADKPVRFSIISPMNSPSQTLSVRLAPEFLKLLNEEAERDGKKPSDCARRHLIRALTDANQTELRAEIEQLHKDFRAMRGDLATLSLYLLVKVGKEKPEQAEAWVRENLAPPGQHSS